MSDFLQIHELYPARALCPWDFPGKNTGVGCHFLLQGTFPNQRLNMHLLHFRQILCHWTTREDNKQFLFYLNCCMKVCCPRPRDLLKSSKVTFSCILAFSALNSFFSISGGLVHLKHILCNNWQNSLSLMRLQDNSRTYTSSFLQRVCCSIITGMYVNPAASP